MMVETLQVNSDRCVESGKTIQACLGDILIDFPWLDICDICHNLYLLTFSFIPIEDLELLGLKKTW